MKDAAVIKALAELGLHSQPEHNSPQIEQLKDRLDQYAKEVGADRADQLTKYLHEGIYDKLPSGIVHKSLAKREIPQDVSGVVQAYSTQLYEFHNRGQLFSILNKMSDYEEKAKWRLEPVYCDNNAYLAKCYPFSRSYSIHFKWGRAWGLSVGYVIFDQLDNIDNEALIKSILTHLKLNHPLPVKNLIAAIKRNSRATPEVQKVIDAVDKSNTAT